MLVKFTIRIWSPILQPKNGQNNYTQLYKSVELPYVPTIGMTFGGNRVNYVNGFFEKPNDILVVFDTVNMDKEDSLESYTWLVESYVKEGWVKS